jgi:membrane protein required for colicin V production
VLVNLLGRILKRVLKPVLSEFLDKALGILFGILKVVLVAGVLFYFIDTVDKKEIFIKHEVKEASVAYKHLSPVMSHVLEWKETRDQEKEACGDNMDSTRE